MTERTTAWVPKAVILAEHYEDSGVAPDLSALAAAVPDGAILAAVAIPDDDVVLLVVAADQLGCVSEAAKRTGVPFDRTIPAVLLTAPAAVLEEHPEVATG